MAKHTFPSKRAKIYQDVPDEKWHDWRWQLSHRLNSAEEFEKIFPLSESERNALNSPDLFRVDITPYFVSLIDPEDPDDPIRKQVIPTDKEIVPFTWHDGRFAGRRQTFTGSGACSPLPRSGVDACHHTMCIVL